MRSWGKEKDYGSIEKGKAADFFVVRGDPSKNISDTQDVESVYIEGKKIDTSFHAGGAVEVNYDESGLYHQSGICR